MKIKTSVLLGVVLDLAYNYPDAVYCKPEWSQCCLNQSGIVKDGPPRQGCIVGQALAKCGLIMDVGGVTSTAIGDYLEMDSKIAYRMLLYIQIEQDGGMSWGRAVMKATTQIYAQ